MTPDSVRSYQLHRRKQAAEAATVNRETSALSRMFQLAIRRGQLERMLPFPKRLEENSPHDGFFDWRRRRSAHISGDRNRHESSQDELDVPNQHVRGVACCVGDHGALAADKASVTRPF